MATKKKKSPSRKQWPAKGDAAGWEKEARAAHKALRDLTDDVTQALRLADKAMVISVGKIERGMRYARIVNMLEVAKDKARFFTLGDDWRKELEEKRKEQIDAQKEGSS